MDTIRAVMGITSDTEDETAGATDSLLSSLHSELAFNDMRDACRRHSKKERQQSSSFHCVAMKSASTRSSGCKQVDVQDSDWATPIPRKEIQTSVLSALRLSDRALGIPTTGLTKCKAPLLTKPHILCQRLGLLKCLQKVFEQSKGTVEERRDATVNAYHDLWLSKVVGEHAFIREISSNGGNTNHPELVLRAGPFTVLTIGVTPASSDAPETYNLCLPTQEKIVKSLEDFEMAPAEPVVAPGTGTLAFRAKGDYLPLANFVAEHLILQIGAGVLRSLCARMKMKKAGNLTHKLRVELFLKTLGYDDQYVQSVLDQIPDRPPRKRKAAGNKEGDDEEPSNIYSFKPSHSCIT